MTSQRTTLQITSKDAEKHRSLQNVSFIQTNNFEMTQRTIFVYCVRRTVQQLYAQRIIKNQQNEKEKYVFTIMIWSFESWMEWKQCEHMKTYINSSIKQWNFSWIPIMLQFSFFSHHFLAIFLMGWWW